MPPPPPPLSLSLSHTRPGGGGILATCLLAAAAATAVSVAAVRVLTLSQGSPPRSGSLRRHVRVPARIAGLGSCGVDFIAQVSEYPNPDDKIRTTDFQVFGGGNAANTLCALGKLGNPVQLITKVGTDANGELIIKELEGSGVSTEHVLQSSKTPSPFTYVIVDQKSSTRTCIHTAATEELVPEEISERMLEGCGWLHLDGRHTPAATRLATLANEMGIPVSLDAEKDRPGLDELLTRADMLFTNSKYPSIFGGKDDLEENLRATLEKLPRLKFVVSTQGSDGSLAMVRDEITDADDAKQPGKNRVIRCPAWQVKPEDIVDTTGAGDTFIAGTIHAMVRGHGLKGAMRLGSYVAARKLEKLGARAGVPTAEDAVAEVGDEYFQAAHNPEAAK